MDKAARARPLLGHDEIAGIEGADFIDWDALVANLRNVESGREDAGEFEKAVESLLSALLYPALTNPRREARLHDGRKRVDITYANVARTGFFGFLSQHYPAAYVFVECKNYEEDPANPELDQLAGRFAPSRGKFGLLVCRHVENKSLMMERCLDTAGDDRGYIVVLDDDDIVQMVDERKREGTTLKFSLIQERFEQLVLRAKQREVVDIAEASEPCPADP